MGAISYRGTTSEYKIPEDLYAVPRVGFTSAYGLVKAIEYTINFDRAKKQLTPIELPYEACKDLVPAPIWSQAYQIEVMLFKYTD